jgi:hypothetical protein
MTIDVNELSVEVYGSKVTPQTLGEERPVKIIPCNQNIPSMYDLFCDGFLGGYRSRLGSPSAVVGMVRFVHSKGPVYAASVTYDMKKNAFGIEMVSGSIVDVPTECLEALLSSPEKQD